MPDLPATPLLPPVTLVGHPNLTIGRGEHIRAVWRALKMAEPETTSDPKINLSLAIGETWLTVHSFVSERIFAERAVTGAF